MGTQTPNYADLAKQHGSIYSIHESDASFLPPEIMRIKNAVGAELVKGQPYASAYGDAIASVGVNEPNKIEINNPAKFAKGAAQTIAHETTHLWQNQLPGPIQKAIPLDNPNHPYDLSNIDQLRAQGRTLATLPHEQAAFIVQSYTADPAQRKRLQPWIDDLNKTPLSVEMPTPPNAKGIISQIRPPTPPIQAYQSPAELKTQAAALQQKFAQSGLAPQEKHIPPITAKPISPIPAQPANALNKHANPEDQPPQVSLAFNKNWSKPGPYAAKLAPQEETEFRKWAAANPQSVKGEVGPAPNFDPLPMADYDVRAHFHASKIGDPAATLVPNKWDGKLHGNDKFKTPYNGGFSNESMYALPNAPRWVGNRLMTHDGKLVTDETPRK